MQAVSGAGYPGVASMDILGNVIPFIGSEEEKMQQETQKILGGIARWSIAPLDARVSAHCNRVSVVDGHVVATSVEFSLQADRRGCAVAPSNSFHERSAGTQTPQRSSRGRVIYMPASGPSAAAARCEARKWHGVFVGRLRECPVLDLKFVACGHNTIRGAAGAAVLNAELMASEGFLD